MDWFVAKSARSAEKKSILTSRGKGERKCPIRGKKRLRSQPGIKPLSNPEHEEKKEDKGEQFYASAP